MRPAKKKSEGEYKDASAVSRQPGGILFRRPGQRQSPRLVADLFQHAGHAPETSPFFFHIGPPVRRFTQLNKLFFFFFFFFTTYWRKSASSPQVFFFAKSVSYFWSFSFWTTRAHAGAGRRSPALTRIRRCRGEGGRQRRASPWAPATMGERGRSRRHRRRHARTRPSPSQSAALRSRRTSRRIGPVRAPCNGRTTHASQNRAFVKNKKNGQNFSRGFVGFENGRYRRLEQKKLN
jgi:hypothetical protein